MIVGRLLLAAGLLAAAAVTGFTGYIVWAGAGGERPSVCYGTAAKGRLEGGRRLPYAGANYRAYSLAAYLLGRTFAHSAVRDAMRDAYAALHKSHPELRFVYAEIGWPWGGSFAPHKTHANGTSVDFLVPVRTLDGKVSELPTSAFNMYGYGVRFDSTGTSKSGTLKLDFEAMGEHLLALDRAAGHGLRRDHDGAGVGAGGRGVGQRLAGVGSEPRAGEDQPAHRREHQYHQQPTPPRPLRRTGSFGPCLTAGVRSGRFFTRHLAPIRAAAGGAIAGRTDHRERLTTRLSDPFNLLRMPIDSLGG